MRHARFLAPLLTVALLVAACSSSGGDAGGGEPSATPSGPGLAVIVASTDLYVGAPQRVAVGLTTIDGQLVSYGTTELAFAFIGTAETPSEPEPGPEATATFVITYGMTDRGGGVPAVTLPSEARGVFEAQDVTFDRAGYWTVTATADVQDLGELSGSSTLAVNEAAAQPAPGQPALATENLTMRSKDAPMAAIDSRFTTEGEIPDPELHRWTIARALEEGRPALVVFGTPVYCVSQFCGPVTDMVQDLSHRYEDRAVFIHIEIWRDFENQVVNEGAADWLYRNGELTEPWLYLIGDDGTILDRWAALWSEDEVAAELERLPPMKG